MKAGDSMVKKQKIRMIGLILLCMCLAFGCSKSEEDIARTEEVKQFETIYGSTERLETQGEKILPVIQETEENSSFEVHFIDVGQADATLILCDDEAMLIDGGNTKDSSLIYTYLKEHNVDVIDYMICTHAHEDHVGGLAGALNYAQVGTVYAPVTSFDSEAFGDFLKYVQRQNRTVTIPDVNTEFMFGTARCTIFGVNTIEGDDPNNTSIVLRVDYGETSFLFSGDNETIVEEIILKSGADINCTVIKVPHHGSDTSLSDGWLRSANPQYAVISVGENNSYGHPSESTLKKLENAGVQIYRTDLRGHIVCRSDGQTVIFETESAKNPGEYSYVLNTNTMKFHYPECSSVNQMKEKNKAYVVSSREELLQQGYAPCGNCHP